jgi:sugar lactone lactonase YvrE
MTQVEHFLTTKNRLGEGPLWHSDSGTLYWVDIEGDCFHTYSLKTDKQKTIQIGQPIGCLAFRTSGGLLIGLRDGLAFWDQKTAEMKIIDNPEKDRKDARFNDGKVDPKGRFWAGTLGDDDQSSLYRLDPDGVVQVMETGIQISNGIGWSPDHTTMYYTDSPRRIIYAYDFDLESGSISNRRDFINVPAEDGLPDGLTVDSEGFIWSAHWDGWRVTRYDPEGKIEQTLYLPVQRPTSCTFGGPELNQLFITSAWTGLSENDRKEQPLAGDLFFVWSDTRGQRENEFLG